MAKDYNDDSLTAVLGMANMANTFMSNARHAAQFKMLKEETDRKNKLDELSNQIYRDMDEQFSSNPDVLKNALDPSTATGTYEGIINTMAKKYPDVPLDHIYDVVGKKQKMITSNLAIDKLKNTYQIASMGYAEVAGLLNQGNVKDAVDRLVMVNNNTQPFGQTTIESVNDDGSVNYVTHSKTEKNPDGTPKVLNDFSGRATPVELLKRSMAFWEPLARGDKNFVGGFLNDYYNTIDENTKAAHTWKSKSGNTAYGGWQLDPVNRNRKFVLSDNGKISEFASESDAIDAGWSMFGAKQQADVIATDLNVSETARKEAIQTSGYATRKAIEKKYEEESNSPESIKNKTIAKFKGNVAGYEAMYSELYPDAPQEEKQAATRKYMEVLSGISKSKQRDEKQVLDEQKLILDNKDFSSDTKAYLSAAVNAIPIGAAIPKALKAESEIETLKKDAKFIKKSPKVQQLEIDEVYNRQFPGLFESVEKFVIEKESPENNPEKEVKKESTDDEAFKRGLIKLGLKASKNTLPGGLAAEALLQSNIPKETYSYWSEKAKKAGKSLKEYIIEQGRN